MTWLRMRNSGTGSPEICRRPISDRPGYERTIARVRGLLGSDDRVLELGCGTGSTALLLAGGTASYLATDFSAGMIGIAEEKLALRPLRS
jgi:methylase of polypeptide subunit release factors